MKRTATLRGAMGARIAPDAGAQVRHWPTPSSPFPSAILRIPAKPKTRATTPTFRIHPTPHCNTFSTPARRSTPPWTGSPRPGGAASPRPVGVIRSSAASQSRATHTAEAASWSRPPGPENHATGPLAPSSAPRAGPDAPRTVSAQGPISGLEVSGPGADPDKPGIQPVTRLDRGQPRHRLAAQPTPNRVAHRGRRIA